MLRPVLGLVGLLLVPWAQAATLQADLQVSGDVVFQGEADLVGGWSGSIQDARLGPVEPFRLLVSGEAVLRTYRYAVAERNGTSPAGHGHDDVLLDRTSEPLGRINGTIGANQHDGHASLRLLPEGTPDLALDRGFVVGIPRDLAKELQEDDPQPPDERDLSYPGVGGGLTGPSIAATPFEGRVVISGWLVETPGGLIDTRWRVSGPTVPGMGGAWVQETAVLEVGPGRVQVLDAWSATWVTMVCSLAGDVDGDLVLHNARGVGELNGTSLPPGLQLLQVAGAMTISADYTKAASQWSIQGEPVFVAANAGTLWGERGAWIATAATALGLAALLAALAGKGVHAVSGLNLAEPLGNERRVRLLSLIAREPGLAQSALANRSATPRPVVRHHLRILLRAGLVTERRVANRKTYTLNDGSFEFALPPAPGNRATGMPTAPALAHFQHPVRKAILETLMARGPCTGAEMRRIWQGQGGPSASRPLVSHHVRKLHGLGLLARSQQDKGTVWSLTFDPAAAVRHQKASFLALGGFKAISDALGRGPLTMDELRACMARAPQRTSRSALDRQLRVLEAVGLVEVDAGGAVRLRAASKEPARVVI